MIDRIIQWSLRNRLIVIVTAALLLVWGTYEAVKMPVDVFPDLTAPTVTVVAEAHGMAPQEVETQITFPVETALNGASGVRRVRSSTGVGIAVIWVEFEWGTDIYQARQVVSEKLQLAQSTLPPGVAPPVLAPVSSIMGEIMFIALTSDRHSPMELKTTADWNIRRRLLAVPGVSQVIPTGGETKQYQVIVRPDRLAAYGFGVDEVVRVLRESNENTSAGFYNEGGQEYLIHGVGRITTLDDIASTMIVERDGQPILVRDVATVQIGSALKRGEGSHNAKPAVILGIQKQPTANTLQLTRQLDAVMADIQKSLPAGMKINSHIFRQSDFIEIAVHNVVSALRDGAILVIAIVFIFLMSVRATGITVLAIPLSLVTAILAMKLFGVTINTMTLGGMAIAVGALVDDAIIDVENVVRRLREGRKQKADGRSDTPGYMSIIYEASREIRGSIVFATAIIILVFLPLFFLSGVEGRLLQPLGFAYVISLAASLVVALTVTPALCSVLLPRSKTVERQEESRVVRWLKRGYEPLLDRALAHWYRITTVAVVLLIIAVAALAFAGRAFLPDFNEGTLTINMVTLPGTSLETSDRLGRMVEQILLGEPEVVATARRTGRAELDEHAQDVNASEMEVSLKMKDRDKEEFLADLRRKLSAVPGTNITIGQPISHRIDHMLSGTRANIAVKIFGEDLATLRKLGEQVKNVMTAVEGTADVSLEQQPDIPFLTVKFDRRAIARYGLQITDVAEAIETAFAGHEVSRILEGRAAFDLVVRYEAPAVGDLDTIRATPIATPGGAQIPLSSLAEIRKDRGPNTISRENVERKAVVMSNVAGRDLTSVVEDIREQVAATVKLPPGYHIEYGGQFESAAEASRRLVLLGIVVVAGILLLLFIALGSLRDAALVMVNLPLALIGGVAGVYVSGGILSVASIIGFITLFGIATRNGLMLISHIQHLMTDEGVTDLREAVQRGALERLSPILMTALSAGLALIPLALALGKPGSEIQTPMAIVILCGLLTSTALNMFIVPALYLRFGSRTATEVVT
ncbi:MAG TPA: efflux RND transporter permease subunit [Thermoanaerobaculia bacterium]|nr:efflux RND transporter permease subunit [Thermoanaerobaculia bacterium]